ncbi:hypothetical protein CLV79_1224 [Limimaricola soesokkakensis]|uniref:Uncharacterized protein n=1 Tax=Limimaricola soesokkakensis TaxID=1343159 RepID=A0A1X7A6J5_9RHOB|nr:hypothetical protein CLV79_1224 [Limimaricola soesokkakensis]SLN71467.1 hypothetical protein LOS8367_03628 [Limimaricola soesokkakensis]
MVMPEAQSVLPPALIDSSTPTAAAMKVPSSFAMICPRCIWKPKERLEAAECQRLGTSTGSAGRFLLGIYEAEGRAMPAYSDISTSAIILQAITYRWANAEN